MSLQRFHKFWLVLAVLLAFASSSYAQGIFGSDGRDGFGGGIISETTGKSCDKIYTNPNQGGVDVNSDGADGDDGGTLNCNTASVLVLEVPLVPSDGSATTYQFSESGSSSGQKIVDPAGCETKGPGYCLYGQSFNIKVAVSEVVTAYELVEEGIAAPFGYLYENCLSRAPANGNTFVPYYEQANCGPADITDSMDYRSCEDPNAFPYFARTSERDGVITKYSVCAFKCGWELRKIQASLENGETLTQYCNRPENITDVADSYLQSPEIKNQFACKRAYLYDDNEVPGITDLLPNFPHPAGFCPCVNSPTKVNPPPDSNGVAQDPIYSASIVGCKSCAGSGSCGTALPTPEPTDPSQCFNMGNMNDPNFDTVCECVNASSFFGSDAVVPEEPDTPGEALGDPNTVCFNTQQPHRCLKCQFDIVQDGGKSQSPEPCAYTDINKYAYCSTFWNDICGSGEYALGDRLRNDKDNRGAVGLCNCQGIFIERAYWVTPVCAPYRIQNPATPRYQVDIELFYASGELAGQAVPGGKMSVGSGFAQFGGIDLTLSWINGTSDGFAVSEIMAEYTKSGGYTSNIQGSIVMCNDGKGKNSYCGMETLFNTTDTGVPNPNIFVTSDKQGVKSPWSEEALQNEDFAFVPLPDFVNGLNQTTFNANNGAWWYYLSQNEQDTFSTTCGANGFTLNGNVDTASSRTMCAGPQGTCIPGVDRRLRGEAIDPPCNVAVDFLDHVVRFNGTQNAKRVAPPHVPEPWDSENPNWYVDRGSLYRTNDPLVVGGQMALRLEISVASDFEGVETAQSNGDISAVGCFISTEIGTGTFVVDATNLGDMTSEFTLFQGSDCSPGIEIPDLTLSLVSGTTQVSVPVSTTSDYTFENAASSFCTVSIAPSFLAIFNETSDTTQRTACTPQFAIPIIVPVLSANVSYTESVAATFFVNYHNDPDCSSFFCGFASGWKHGGFLTSFYMLILSLVLPIVFTLLIALGFVTLGNRMNYTIQEKTAISVAIQNQIQRIHINTGN